MRMIAFLCLSVSLGLMTGVSCGGDEATGPGGSIYGTYNLETIRGEPLPVGVSIDMYMTVDLRGGTWLLSNDGTWSATWTYRYTFLDEAGKVVGEDTTTDDWTGTYVKDGMAILFTHSDGSTFSGSISGSVLTVMLNEHTPAVFTK